MAYSLDSIYDSAPCSTWHYGDIEVIPQQAAAVDTHRDCYGAAESLLLALRSANSVSTI
jgi:hypothetical protein